MFKISRVLLTTALAAVMFTSCHRNQQSPVAAESAEVNGISLTREQIKLAGIEFGKLEKRELSGDINARGKIVLPPDNDAIVSSVMGGMVESILVMPGEQVRKGTVLALMMHPEFISLQEAYLQAVNRFNLVESEYLRQQKLFDEKVSSEKQLLESKTEFQALKSQIKALEIRLVQTGVSPEKVSQNEIERFIPVKSPIDGIVNAIFTTLGKNVTETDPLFEVVCRKSLFVELSVFEKDIMKIKKGQRVTFDLANINNQKYEASVIAVGSSVDEMGRVVKVIAEFKNRDDVLLPGMFVAAEIHSEEEEMQALPENAIMNFGSESTFVYYTLSAPGAEKLIFSKAFVKTGFAEDSFIQVELLDQLPDGAMIVTNGGYYIRSEEAKNEE